MALVRHVQVMASTHEDAHGERYDKKWLDDMVESMPTRWPLHQRHDMALPTVGYVENPRVVPDPDSDGDWLLVAEVEYDDSTVPPDLNGFSWSVTQGMFANCPDPEISIYLPWPLYNDQQEVDRFLGLPGKVGVGKWIKKSLSPEQIALIQVVCAVATVTQPLWYPFWEKYAQEVLWPNIQSALTGLRSLWARGITTDLSPRMWNMDGTECRGYLVPDRGAEEASFSKDALAKGMQALAAAIQSANEKEHRNLRMVKAVYEKNKGAYRVFHIEYDDGTAIHLVA